MNVKEFKTTAAKNPYARISTARYTLRDRTIFVKVDSGNFLPMLSYMDDFLIWWGDPRTRSTRTDNLTWELRHGVKTAWDEKIHVARGGGESLARVTMHITEQNIHLKSSDLKPGITKTLAAGINPNGESRDPEVRRGFQEPFENAITALAYGAIQHENTLTEMSKQFVQQTPEIEGILNLTEQKLATRRGSYFAPSQEEIDAGINGLQEVITLTEKIDSSVESIKSLCSDFRELAETADSVILEKNPKKELCRPYWDGEERRLLTGGFGFRIDQYSYNISLRDIRDRSFSYYHVRENYDFYRSVLQRCGIILKHPWGIHPAKWDQTTIAVPVFASLK